MLFSLRKGKRRQLHEVLRHLNASFSTPFFFLIYAIPMFLVKVSTCGKTSIQSLQRMENTFFLILPPSCLDVRYQH